MAWCRWWEDGWRAAEESLRARDGTMCTVILSEGGREGGGERREGEGGREGKIIYPAMK